MVALTPGERTDLRELEARLRRYVDGEALRIAEQLPLGGAMLLDALVYSRWQVGATSGLASWALTFAQRVLVHNQVTRRLREEMVAALLAARLVGKEISLSGSERAQMAATVKQVLSEHCDYRGFLFENPAHSSVAAYALPAVVPDASVDSGLATALVDAYCRTPPPGSLAGVPFLARALRESRENDDSHRLRLKAALEAYVESLLERYEDTCYVVDALGELSVGAQDEDKWFALAKRIILSSPAIVDRLEEQSPIYAASLIRNVARMQRLADRVGEREFQHAASDSRASLRIGGGAILVVIVLLVYLAWKTLSPSALRLVEWMRGREDTTIWQDGLLTLTLVELSVILAAFAWLSALAYICKGIGSWEYLRPRLARALKVAHGLVWVAASAAGIVTFAVERILRGKP